MIDLPPTDEQAGDPGAFLDALLREALPEVKLALGELIDRENSRSLPERYARLLPESVLVVTLRTDAAAAIAPLAETVERDLSDSVLRHGSLYDRSYRVQLRRSEDLDAPLYRVTAHAGHGIGQEEDAAPGEITPAGGPSAPTEILPAVDPDATRLDTAGPAGWSPGQWVLVVENLEGEEIEVFRLVDPYTTLGRQSADPELRTTIALRDVPHLSRRQLVLLFEERDGEPGFRVHNLGLNPVHAPDREIVGAKVKRGALDLDAIPGASSHWVRAGAPLRIGDHGPVLRIEEVPPDPEEDGPDDPEATVHD